MAAFAPEDCESAFRKCILEKKAVNYLLAVSIHSAWVVIQIYSFGLMGSRQIWLSLRVFYYLCNKLLLKSSSKQCNVYRYRLTLFLNMGHSAAIWSRLKRNPHTGSALKPFKYFIKTFTGNLTNHKEILVNFHCWQGTLLNDLYRNRS